MVVGRVVGSVFIAKTVNGVIIVKAMSDMTGCDPKLAWYIAYELALVAILFPCNVNQVRESFNEKIV